MSKPFFTNVAIGKRLKLSPVFPLLHTERASFQAFRAPSLKAEIDGEGIPVKESPQGGLLSPLLLNIVLNELCVVFV